jgi:excisionase family DNA binding protein
LKKIANNQPKPTVGLTSTNFVFTTPTNPSKPTVYGWVNAGTIPVHKGGKKLRFLKSEIDNWLRQGRKKTLAETASEAENI